VVRRSKNILEDFRRLFGTGGYAELDGSRVSHYQIDYASHDLGLAPIGYSNLFFLTP
jgi:hypothetical protein